MVVTDICEMSDFLEKNSRVFLSKRALQADQIRSVVTRQFHDANPILLTSSAVHGIDTPASDVDLMCITKASLPKVRMATQIHYNESHIEIAAFTEKEIDLALTRLSDLAAADPRTIVVQLHAWDQNNVVRRKYVERLINGVQLDMTVPYKAYFNKLGRIWAIAAMESFERSLRYSVLSVAAEQTRGAVGYAIAALIALMDSVLAAGGWSLTNPKWSLKRWRSEKGRRIAGKAKLFLVVDELWGDVTARFGSEIRSSDLERIIQLAPLLRESLELEENWITSASVGTGGIHPFLPGASFMMVSGGSLLVRGKPDNTARGYSLDSLRSLSKQDACSALQYARSGADRYSTVVNDDDQPTAA